MPSSDSPREISRIEILEHPFYGLYNHSREKPVSSKELAHLVEKWKQRIRAVSSDPNAILVLVRSAYELGEAPPYLSHTVKPEESEKLKELEKELIAFAKRTLERKNPRSGNPAKSNRLFLGLEDKSELELGSFMGLRQDIGTDYSIDHDKFKRELRKREMVLSKKPVVWAYGAFIGDRNTKFDEKRMSASGCVNFEFNALREEFGLDFDCKIVHSLSVPISKNSKIFRGIDFRGSMIVPRLEKFRRAVRKNRRKWQRSLPKIPRRRRK